MTEPPQGNDPSQYGARQSQGQPGYGPPPPPYHGGRPGYPGGYGQQPPRRQTGPIIALGVIALLLVAGGVGGFLLLRGDDKGDGDSAAPDESTSAPTSSAQTTTADPTTPDASASTAAPSTASVEPPNIPPGLAYCQRIRTNAQTGRFDDVAPDEVDDLFAETQVLQQLAPADLRDDYQLLIDALNGESADINPALQNIQAYSAAECSVTAD